MHTMYLMPLTAVPTLEEAARWTAEQVVGLAGERLVLGRQFEAMKREVETLKHQIDWFRRQIFGQKSEKRPLEANPHQMIPGELPVPESSPQPQAKEIPAHTSGRSMASATRSASSIKRAGVANSSSRPWAPTRRPRGLCCSPMAMRPTSATLKNAGSPTLNAGHIQGESSSMRSRSSPSVRPRHWT